MATHTQPSSADDHAAITNLIARYCLALDLADADAWVDLFVPDAVYEVYGRTFVGHEGLRSIVTGAPGGVHLGGPVAITIDGDTATTMRNLMFVALAAGETRYAVYDDQLVRSQQGWKIAHCRCRFHTPTGLADRPPKV